MPVSGLTGLTIDPSSHFQVTGTNGVTVVVDGSLGPTTGSNGLGIAPGPMGIFWTSTGVLGIQKLAGPQGSGGIAVGTDGQPSLIAGSMTSVSWVESNGASPTIWTGTGSGTLTKTQVAGPLAADAQIVGFATDGSTLFWSVMSNPTPLVTMLSTGGKPTPVTAQFPRIIAMAVDMNNFYFVDTKGVIWFGPRTAPTFTQIASQSNANAIAIAMGTLYWGTSDGFIYSVSTNDPCFH